MENNKTKSSAIQKILKCGIISWVIIIAIWTLGAVSIKDEYFLPSPKQTLISIKLLIENGTLWADIAASAGRVIKGWLLAIVFAVPLGLLVGNFRVVRWLVEPILSFFRFVPAIALTTLFLMWFGVG
ncbi:ABC transporter permease, partial [uncultured Ruminococcus sp.]